MRRLLKCWGKDGGRCSAGISFCFDYRIQPLLIVDPTTRALPSLLFVERAFSFHFGIRGCAFSCMIGHEVRFSGLRYGTKKKNNKTVLLTLPKVVILRHKRFRKALP